MPDRITELRIIFQKPIDPQDYGIDEEDLDSLVTFQTEGQEDFKKLVHVGIDSYAENTLFTFPANIPTGITGASEMLKRFTMRMLSEKVNIDKDWEYFYVVARFQRTNKSEYFRTVVRRTKINRQIRRL